MAIPAGCFRLVLAGKLGPGVDTWNVVLHAQSNGEEFPAGFNQNYAQKAVDDWASVMFHAAGVGGDFATSTTVETATLYSLDETNHVLEIYPATVTVDPAHGATAQALPSEVTVCASLSSGYPGRSKNGRSYLPGLSSLALGNDGLLSEDAPSDLSAQYAAYLSGLNTYDGDSDELGRLNIVVLSPTKNMATKVIGVRVGNVFDVQRRRRNGGPETYTGATVTESP